MTQIGTSTGAFFDRASTGIAGLRKQAEALQSQLGSGQKLARSSQDPVAASRLRNLSRAGQLSGIDMTNANMEVEFKDSKLAPPEERSRRRGFRMFWRGKKKS